MAEIGQDFAVQIGRTGADLLEIFTGSKVPQFQPYILLTSIRSYVDKFAEMFSEKIFSGTSMTSAHCEQHKISIIYFGIGSPAAALIVELLANINPLATLFLGTCQGLREEYLVGDYFNPVASIRGDGTSASYLPIHCPSLSSFVIQRYVCQVLEQNILTYHTGVVHTTNILLWNTKEDFKEQLLAEMVQAVDNECATLFTVGFVYRVPVGALMLISSLPLKETTATEGLTILGKYTDMHLQLGLKVLKSMQQIESEGFGYQF